MSKVVIYPLPQLAEEGGAKIAVLFPAPSSRLTVEQIAQKDVPIDAPYLIVDATDLPADPTYRDAWDADFTQPSGHGLGSEEFYRLNPHLLPTPVTTITPEVSE